MEDKKQTGIVVYGRIVWTVGDLFKGQQIKDMNTGALQFNQDGSPKIEFGFGLAIPKTHCGEILTLCEAEARKIFPSGNYPKDFAWKVQDGDGFDSKGLPFNTREGYALHNVFACKTRIAPAYAIHDGTNNMVVQSGFKSGDYVEVTLNVAGHPAIGRGKAGLYLNPMGVRMQQVGNAIISRPSVDSMFGTSAPQMPAGYQIPPAQMSFQAPPQQQQVPQNWNVLPPQHQQYQQAPMQQQAPQHQPQGQVGLPPQPSMQQQAPQPTAVSGFPFGQR
jgi:hypothetical protein